eukprot:gene18409-biopygen21952
MDGTGATPRGLSASRPLHTTEREVGHFLRGTRQCARGRTCDDHAILLGVRVDSYPTLCKLAGTLLWSKPLSPEGIRDDACPSCVKSNEACTVLQETLPLAAAVRPSGQPKEKSGPEIRVQGYHAQEVIFDAFWMISWAFWPPKPAKSGLKHAPQRRGYTRSLPMGPIDGT